MQVDCRGICPVCYLRSELQLHLALFLLSCSCFSISIIKYNEHGPLQPAVVCCQREGSRFPFLVPNLPIRYSLFVYSQQVHIDIPHLPTQYHAMHCPSPNRISAGLNFMENFIYIIFFIIIFSTFFDTVLNNRHTNII